MPESLIERDTALAAVRALIEAASVGRGKALFVIGEAGLGKTTVLEHAVTMAGRQFRVGIGRADVAEAALPFGLISQAVDPLLGGQVESTPSPDALSPPPVGGYLYAVLSRLRTGPTEPMLLALDDAHWSDSDSLTLLRLICRRIATLPVAVLVTARPWPPDALRAGEELSGHGVADVQELAPLSRDSAVAMLSERSGAAVSGEDLGRLAALCADNPLLLDRVAAAMRTGQSLPEAEAPTQTSWARRLLLSHLAGLGDPTVRFLRAAAVIGRRFRPEMAAQMAGLTLAETAAVREAIAVSGLVRDAGDGWAEFAHELIRQAVYELAAPVCASLHEAAFRVLLARRANPAEAAAHAVAARLAGDPDAISVLARAGREALNAGAVGAARRHLQAGADLAGHDAPADLLADLGGTLMADGSHAAAAALYEDLLQRGSMPRTTRFEILSRLSLARVQARRFDDADACLGEALRLAGSGQPDLAAAAMVNHAVQTMLNRSMTAALPLASRAREHAARAGPAVRAAADAAWAWCAYTTGNPDGLELARQAASSAVGMTAWKPPGTPWFDPVVAYAITAISAERFADAERQLAGLLDAAERRADPMTISRALFFLATCLLRQGRLEEAMVLCGRLAEAAEVVPLTSPLAAVANACVLLELGRLNEAADWCDRVKEAALQGAGFRISVLMGYHPRALLAFRRGSLDEACAIFASLEQSARDYGIADPCSIPWAGDAIAAFLACGRETDARRVIASLKACAGIFPALWPTAIAAAGSAALAERYGDQQEASRQYGQALAVVAQMQMPLVKAQVLTDYGAFMCRHGDARGARPLLADALRIAEGCGAAWHAERARVEWRRAGGRTGTTPAGQLTPQETAVARLATAGLTNKEIAAQLYLSVNTVETHLAHVYQKLGISRRRQLPSLIGESQQTGHP